MKKITPLGVGLDLAGDAIEGGLAGAGAAIGGAASGIGALAGGLAQGAGAALGGALQGALTEPDVYVSSYGATGAYAKSNIKTTVKIQIPNGPQRIEATEDMPLEKLMTIAIKYLSSISKNLKAQAVAENKNNEQERLSSRENLIETPTTPVPVSQDGEQVGKKKMSGMTKALLGLGAVGLGAAALGKIDLSQLEDLGKNIEAFKEQYGWLVGWGSAAAMLLSIPGLGKLLWTVGKSATMAAADAIVAGTTAIGGSIVLGSALAFGGAAAVAIAAPFTMYDEGKKGFKKALTVQDHLSKYGIDVKTSGGLGVGNTYSKNGKPLTNKEAEMAGEYGAAIAGIRNSSTIEELDKKYSKMLIPSAASTGSNIRTTSMKDSKYKADDGSYNAKFALSFFKARGWSHEQASGIVGNLLVESPGLNPHPKPGDGGKAYGIAQWHPDRQAVFEKVMGKNIRKSSLEDQLRFVDWELKNSNKKAGNLLRGATSAEMAAAIVDKEYERSAGLHTGQRMAAAKNVASGDFTTPAPGSYSDSSPMTQAKEMITAGYDKLVDFIKAAGTTDTQFRPLTSKAGTWDKSAKLLKDQAKMEADMTMGRKEDKIKNEAKPNSTTSRLRNMNGGVLDVIDPNYRLNSTEGILASYIMNFSTNKEVWV